MASCDIEIPCIFLGGPQDGLVWKADKRWLEKEISLDDKIWMQFNLSKSSAIYVSDDDPRITEKLTMYFLCFSDLEDD